MRGENYMPDDPTPDAPADEPGEDTAEHPVVEELRERLDDAVPPRDDDPDRPDRAGHAEDRTPPRPEDTPDDEAPPDPEGS